MLNRNDLITELKKAANSGSLLNAKHDPNTGITYENFRTVLTPQASASLQELINSEQYDFEAYYNKRHRKYAYVLLPYDNSTYNPVGLGLPSGSLATTGSFDTFLITSGSANGWHVYAEDYAKMQAEISKNQIEYKGKL